MAKVFSFISLLFIFFLSGLFLNLSSLSALNLYMNKYALISKDASAQVRNFVLIHRQEDKQEDKQQDKFILDLLNLRVNVPKNRLSLIPARVIRSAIIESRYEGSLILIGGRTGLIPLTCFSEETLWFYKELLNFIDSLDRLKNGRIEVELLSSLELPEYEPGIKPVFKLVRLNRRMGYLADELEIDCYYFKGESGIEILSKREKTENILFKIHQFIPAAVLKQFAFKGEKIHINKIDFPEKDVMLIDEEPVVLKKIDELKQYYIKRDLPAGTLIKMTDIEKPPCVKAGDRVKIYFIRGNIHLDMYGKAYSSGETGDPVVVRPVNSNKRFDCVVIGQKEVKIEIP